MAIPKWELSAVDNLKTYGYKSNAVVGIKSMINGDYIHFLAYITDMAQSFDVKWNEEEVYGRNDPIAIFQGTKRSISIAFSVPAGNMNEATNNMHKIDALVAFMYPSYKSIVKPGSQYHLIGYHLAQPPLVKIKMANLINKNNGTGNNVPIDFEDDVDGGLMGYIGSLSINPVMEAGTYDINMNDFSAQADYEGYIAPSLWEISFDFNVLHQSMIGWDENTGKWFGERFLFGSRISPEVTEDESAETGGEVETPPANELPASDTDVDHATPITDNHVETGESFSYLDE